MGHVVGSDIFTGKNLEDAFSKAKFSWSDDPSFINQYRQENIATDINLRKEVNLEGINPETRVTKKEKELARNYNMKRGMIDAEAIPLGIDKWIKYSTSYDDKGLTAKKYLVFDNEVEHKAPENHFTLDPFGNPKEIDFDEKRITEDNTTDFDRKIALSSVYTSKNKAIKRARREWLAKDRPYDHNYYIINQNGYIIVDIKMDIKESDTKLKKLKTPYKKVVPLYAYMFHFDVSVD